MKEGCISPQCMKKEGVCRPIMMCQTQLQTAVTFNFNIKKNALILTLKWPVWMDLWFIAIYDEKKDTLYFYL